MDRRALFGAIALGGLATAAVAQTATPRSLAERFAATLEAHDIEAFAALFAADYRNHQMSAAAPAPAGSLSEKQGTVGFFQARLRGIPDLKVSIEALVAGDDRAAASFVYTGTHQGVLMGVAPTGRALRFTSCDIFGVRDGLIAEHWGMGDIAGVLAQVRA